MIIQESSRLSEAISPPPAVKKKKKSLFSSPTMPPRHRRISLPDVDQNTAAPPGPENHGNQNAYIDCHIHRPHAAG